MLQNLASPPFFTHLHPVHPLPSYPSLSKPLTTASRGDKWVTHAVIGRELAPSDQVSLTAWNMFLLARGTAQFFHCAPTQLYFFTFLFYSEVLSKLSLFSAKKLFIGTLNASMTGFYGYFLLMLMRAGNKMTKRHRSWLEIKKEKKNGVAFLCRIHGP